MAERDLLLVINAGSSSLKVEGFDANDSALSTCIRGTFSGIGTVHPHLVISDGDDNTLIDVLPMAHQSLDADQAQTLLADQLTPLLPGRVVAVGHRIVHGGPSFDRPVILDTHVLEQLAALTPLAPLHQPANLAPVRSILRRRPDLPQIGCFDTAFHHDHEPMVERLPIPEALHEEGVRRYGFHGLSYEYIAGQLPTVAPEIAQGRVVVAHLGNGCSLCALHKGRSIDSSMGFTALDGLPMGSRPGRLDAGVLLYLMQQKRLGPEAMEQLLYHECGLQALSGISSDVQVLSAKSDARADFALAYLARRVAMGISELATALGGLDGIVFTAGIGEHSARLRRLTCTWLGWLGIALDDTANQRHASCISALHSERPVHVIPTDEARMIAEHVRTFLSTPH
ncbi:acetate/propionate family kinase [Larsenimonas rhizosphaerae]|uniref:Acetate kinase n=1 Tax=Larsenimonas rhizosphaerae TaxID=2944682 RepID=A0AA41ZJJ5_9GAMM|nr:acetate/propionate family kinase [Larsenimonas rhizosphaerae]MCX2523001.1 acetate/propionate family kinase [Larsenimonas rhizosphaerae]